MSGLERQACRSYGRATVKLNLMPPCMCSAMWQWTIHRGDAQPQGLAVGQLDDPQTVM
jgi:hypothetical protein